MDVSSLLRERPVVSTPTANTRGHSWQLDLILRGGTIIDGTGSAAFGGDIGVEAGVISAIGDLSAAQAECEFDVHDLVVAPGFIDAHTHSDLTSHRARRFRPRR